MQDPGSRLPMQDPGSRMPMQDPGSRLPMQDAGSRLLIQGWGPGTRLGAALGSMDHFYFGSFWVLFGAHLDPFGVHFYYFGALGPIFRGCVDSIDPHSPLHFPTR